MPSLPGEKAAQARYLDLAGELRDVIASLGIEGITFDALAERLGATLGLELVPLVPRLLQRSRRVELAIARLAAAAMALAVLVVEADRARIAAEFRRQDWIGDFEAVVHNRPPDPGLDVNLR